MEADGGCASAAIGARNAAGVGAAWLAGHQAEAVLQFQREGMLRVNGVVRWVHKQ